MMIDNTNFYQHISSGETKVDKCIFDCYRSHAETNQLVINSDYAFIACKNAKSIHEPVQHLNLTASSINDIQYFPIFYANGLRKVIQSESRLSLNVLRVVDSNTVSLKNNKLSLAPHQADEEWSHAICSGMWQDTPIYGYVSKAEVLELIPEHSRTHKTTAQLVGIETAFYRAIQRLNHGLFGKVMQEFLSIHHLRNFQQFIESDFSHDAFSTAVGVINSRKDYLTNLSSLWSQYFERERTYLAFSLSRHSVQYDLSKQDVQMLAYRLASDAAELNLSLDPVYGHSYVGAFENVDECESDNKDGKPSFVIAETTHGRLDRCYKQANLKSIRCDVVYEQDSFEIKDGMMVEHDQPAFNSDKKGAVAGSYASLIFTDGTISNVFLSASDLKEIAELSNVDTWHSVFSQRMMCKQALMEALRNCDWNQKHIIHRSLYLDANHSQTGI